MALLELRLDDFLDQVASANRTPGGGSVAALVTAAAAGLLAKVARASTGTWSEARGVAAQAEALRDRIAPVAERRREAYEAALATRGDDFELGRAYARAAEPPLLIVEAAADVAMLSAIVARCGEASLRADAVRLRRLLPVQLGRPPSSSPSTSLRHRVTSVCAGAGTSRRKLPAPPRRRSPAARDRRE